MNHLKLTNESLDELMGFTISDDSLFSEGTVLAIDGGAWELVAICGTELVFEPHDSPEAAMANNLFFWERAQ